MARPKNGTIRGMGSPTDVTTPPFQRPTLPQIAGAFLLIGATAFGGQAPLLALLNREIVARRGWATEADVLDAFTYCKLLPGPLVAQVATFLGYRIGGVSGAAMAGACFVTPPVLAMLILAVTYTRFAQNAGIGAALTGLMGAVVGIVAVGTWTQARKLPNAANVAVAVAVGAAAVVWNPNPAWLILGAGLFGVVRELVKPAETPEAKAEGEA